MVDEMFDSPEEVPAKWPRDGKGRPQVWLPDHSRQVGYTRVTSYIKCMADTYALELWEKRMVAIGLAERPDLLLSVAAHRDDRRELNRIVEQAKEAAKANAKSTVGTGLHKLADSHDRGQPIVVPPAWQADMEAYKATTAEMDMIHIEQPCVQDGLKVGGTPDRVVGFRGGYYIADIKTGSIDFGALEFAMQFATYAHSKPYDFVTGGRGEWPKGLNILKAILIHLPQGEGTCKLHWVNIAAGWDAVAVAKAIRAFRNHKGLMVEMGGELGMISNANRLTVSVFLDRVKRATTLDDVRLAYQDARKAGLKGNDVLEACQVRKAELEGAQ